MRAALEMEFESTVCVPTVLMLEAMPNDLFLAFAHFDSHAPATFITTNRTTAKRDSIRIR